MTQQQFDRMTLEEKISWFMDLSQDERRKAMAELRIDGKEKAVMILGAGQIDVRRAEIAAGVNTGSGAKPFVFFFLAVAIAMAAVWWWPCGGLSLWWKIPLSVVGVIIAIVVGIANAD